MQVSVEGSNAKGNALKIKAAQLYCMHGIDIFKIAYKFKQFFMNLTRAGQ